MPLAIIIAFIALVDILHTADAQPSPHSKGRWNFTAPGLDAKGSFTQTKLDIELPNGKIKTFHRVGARAKQSWHGEDTKGLSMNVLARTFPNVGRIVVGSLVDGDSVYKIGQDANGDTFIEEFQNLPDEAEPVDNHQSGTGTGDYDTKLDTTTAAEATIEGGNIIIDIILVWTDNAECRNSGLSRNCSLTAQTTANMEARLNLAIEETNTAYALLSDINARLRLVHAYRHLDYVEASSDAFSSALYAMQNPSDGIMDDVHSVRTDYGADLVALIIDDRQYCGIGYVGPSKSYGFSVTAWNCATGYYSFAHEVGHNLGYNHDIGTSNACGTTDFNYGYRDPQAGFRTILAYNCQMGQCDSMPKSGCSRTQRFSNPNQITSTGSPWGATNANNVQHINNVAAAVSGWYPPATTGESPRPQLPPQRVLLMRIVTFVAGPHVRMANVQLLHQRH